MKNLLISIIVLVLIAIFSWLTNPGLKDHQEAVLELFEIELKYELERKSQNSDGEFGQNFGTSLGMTLAKSIVDEIIVSDNHFFFSRTKVSFGNKNKIIGFGVLGNVYIDKNIKKDDIIAIFSDSENMEFDSSLFSIGDDLKNDLKQLSDQMISVESQSSDINESYPSEQEKGIDISDESAEVNNSTKITTLEENNIVEKDLDTEYSIGNFIVQGKEDGRANFHNEPAFSTIRRAYLVTGEKVYINKILNGFGYTEFINLEGKKSTGWIDMTELIPNQ